LTLVGVLEKHGKHYAVTPLFEAGHRVEVEKPRREGVGDLVEVGAAKGRRFRVVRRLGRPDVARDVLEGLMLHRGLRRRFDPLVEREARNAEPEEVDRRDLRALPTFTIDPPTARDFDDAISAEALDDGAVRVWVHIADVSAFVRPGSALDREAFRRGTSVYVPGLVEPMLPEALSNGSCSLVPHQDRLAVTVELEFEGATVRRTAFHRSVIRSDVRLSYPEVDALFAAGDPGPPGLAAARRVARALAAKRADRGALSVESTEPEFDFSRDGHVQGVEASETTESHELIEFLMIAANEAVADLLERRKLAGVFRVHEPPDPTRVERLLEQLTSLDLPVPPAPEHLTAKQAGELVEEAARRVHGPAYTSLILRSLKQARYCARNLGHFGLRSERYCHFTSPIRRYPDLICHRALLSAIGFAEATVRASDLEPAAEWCSQRERDAMTIERAADNVARAFLLESELFRGGSWERAFRGEVRGVIGAGAFVAFDGYEGLLPVRKLGDDWWELNEQETMLVARGAGKRLRIGDEVTVQVERIDAPRGRVDLLPVEL
jgi:ribonuclease R